METNTTELLLDLIKQELDVDAAPDMTFEELGMDSLDFVLLVQEIRDKIGPITDAQARRCTTVSDLLAVLKS